MVQIYYEMSTRHYFLLQKLQCFLGQIRAIPFGDKIVTTFDFLSLNIYVCLCFVTQWIFVTKCVYYRRNTRPSQNFLSKKADFLVVVVWRPDPNHPKGTALIRRPIVLFNITECGTIIFFSSQNTYILHTFIIFRVLKFHTTKFQYIDIYPF